MNASFVSFDDMQDRVANVINTVKEMPAAIGRIYFIRDLLGCLRVSVSDVFENDESCREALDLLANELGRQLGAHCYGREQTVLFLDEETLQELDAVARPLSDQGRIRAYWVERLVTGHGWWSVAAHPSASTRFTLYSVKGGVGRSTTTAVLAWHLARSGYKVLVIDLDVESPGLSSGMLNAGHRPQYGVVDWFVEDLVQQGDRVVEAMAAAPLWMQDLDGDVRVVPAYGREPGEYLAKLGRLYMDTDETWAVRLKRLVSQLENLHKPSIVLLESRSGLHDVAAATVTDLDAQVLLFALDSVSHWDDYTILFRHWREQAVATAVRDRLSIVSGLTPDFETPDYLLRFRERAWDLFRDHLYDDVPPSDESTNAFSFDLLDEDAPHAPLVIYWTRGLSAGAPLRNLKPEPVGLGYHSFLTHFDRLLARTRLEKEDE